MGSTLSDDGPSFSDGQPEKSVGRRMMTAECTVEEVKTLSRTMKKLSGESLKEFLPRIARRTGISERAAAAYHKGEYRSVDAHVYINYLIAAEEHERQLQQRFEANRANRARLHQLIHNSSDPEFYSGRAVEAFGPDGLARGTGKSEAEG